MPIESCPEPNKRPKGIFRRLGKRLLDNVDQFGAAIARASHTEPETTWSPNSPKPLAELEATPLNTLTTEDHLDWTEFCMLRDEQVVTAAQVLRRIGPGLPETRP